MERSPNDIAGRMLRERRLEIQRSLSRVSTASVAVVLVTIGLAVAAGLAALHAGRQAELTRAANQRAREELWKSYLAQAQAGRLSGVMGRKASGLAAIRAAAAIRPSLELRNEAIAHLALLDFKPSGLTWSNTPGLARATVDPQFKRQLEGDSEGTIYLRSLWKADQTFTLRNTNGFVSQAEFAPDGRSLAVTYSNTVLTVWDLESQRPQFARAGVSWAGFDREGTSLGIVGNDRSVRVLDAATGAEKAAFKIDATANLGVFDPGGGQLALCAGTVIEIWDWRAGQRRDAMVVDHPVYSLDWRGHILAAGDEGGEVHLWDLVTRRRRPLQAHQGVADHVAFNPQGDVLLSTSYDGSTKVWDPFTGRLLFTTPQGFGWRFSADGRQVLFGTESGWSVWQVSEPQGYRRLDCASGPQPNVWHVDFSLDGEWLVATKEDGISVFGAGATRPACFQPGEQMRAAYFLRDGTKLLTTSARQIDCWTFETNLSGTKPGFRLGHRQPLPLTDFVHLEPGALTADRRQLALPTSQTRIAMLNLERPVETVRITNAMLPGTLSFSPDARWLAAGTFHGPGTRVWDLQTHQPVQDFKEGNAGALFSPDGRFLVSAGSRLYQIFEAGSWKRVFARPVESGSDLPNRVAFSRDPALLALVQQRHRVELHDVNGWQLAAALMPPDPLVVTWLAFSPDGHQLAVATSQDLVQLWDFRILQQQLARLGLAWKQSEPVTNSGSIASLALPDASRTWGSQWIAPVIVGALVVIGCTLFIRHRQRRLLSAYMETDDLAELQHQQLGRAQTEVLQAQKMKALGTLAAGIAHDFNNLLSVVRLSNKLIGREAEAQPQIQESVDEIEQAVQRGKAVVRSMLGYTREAPESEGPFSVPELVEDTVALLTKQFLSGITLTLKLEKDAPPVTGSRNRLEQILLNLLVNASEAMNGNGKLHVGLRPLGTERGVRVLAPRPASGYLELFVRDTGPGIPPEILPRIFEPFFTTKEVGASHGTGLGLHLVYSIARQDGLGILVHTVPKHGATFSILIPVTPESVPEAPA